MKLRYKISIWLALALAGSLLWGGSVWLWLVENPGSDRILLYSLPLFPILAFKGEGNVLVTLLCPKLA